MIAYAFEKKRTQRPPVTHYNGIHSGRQGRKTVQELSEGSDLSLDDDRITRRKSPVVASPEKS